MKLNNKWELFKVKKNIKPLAISANSIICYSRGNLVQFDRSLNHKRKICKIAPDTLKFKLGSNWRLIDRVLRLSPQASCLFGNLLYLSISNLVLEVNLYTGLISDCFELPKGRKVLSFSICNIDFENVIFFGEYGANPTRQPMSIWCKRRSSPWKIIFTFAKGTIEHIHAIKQINSRIYALTGDFEDAAAIHEIQINDTQVNAHTLISSQDARACWLHHFNGYLYYATDTQLSSNSLYRTNSDLSILDKICSLPGSSIYSSKSDSSIFFSTTVEPGMPSGLLLRDLLDTKRGPGIYSDDSRIYEVPGDGTCVEIASCSKDRWPYRLGQFGSFSFPFGKQDPCSLIVYATALKHIDGAALILKKL